MDVESLYPLVSEAIRRAEVLEDLNAPGARSAHLDVSLIEERIAALLPASDAEGAIARRGAVRAAIAAQEFRRAHELASRFAGEAAAGHALKADLRTLGKKAARSAALEGRRSAAGSSTASERADAAAGSLTEAEALRDLTEKLQKIKADLKTGTGRQAKLGSAVRRLDGVLRIVDSLAKKLSPS